MKEVEHLGQEYTWSVTARLQTGMAKKRMINTIIIQSDNLFFIFSFPSLPISQISKLIEAAYLVPNPGIKQGLSRFADKPEFFLNFLWLKNDKIKEGCF